MRNKIGRWPLRRFLYLFGGVFFILLALFDRAYWMLIFGVYFAAMALFGFGCAGESCALPPSDRYSD